MAATLRIGVSTVRFVGAAGARRQARPDVPIAFHGRLSSEETTRESGHPQHQRRDNMASVIEHL
jgi:hypothetical protein